MILINAMHTLREARVAKKLSQGEVAQLCGWENAAGRVSNYENLSREPSLSDLDKLASVLGLSLEQVLFNNFNDKQRTNFIQLPLLKMSEVADYAAGKLTDIKRSVNMYIATVDVSQKLFALTINGDAMESKDNIKRSICDGDIVAVKLNAQPKPRNIVLALVNGEAKVREYSKDGTEEVLKAYNSQYNNIKIGDNVKILGTIVHRSVDLEV